MVAAPAVLAGTIAAALLLPPAAAMSRAPLMSLEAGLAAWIALATHDVLDHRALEAAAGARVFLLYLVFWSCLFGGVLDRYARNRATRAVGFFAASGAHAGALLRLTLMVVVVQAVALDAAGRAASGDAADIVWTGLVLAVGIVAAFARVRLVVEDRRSAIGALLAAFRFIRRNPASVVIFAAWALVELAVAAGMGTASAQVSGHWPLVAITSLGDALLVAVTLAWHASAIALFQSRLAHAGYTAAPPARWPESPAAEAIANAAAAGAP
jgi:hypothetical protein